jgi:MSHA pilin protein MshD
VKQPGGARGVTLVELIVSIVIVGVGVAGILSVMNLTTRRSADPMIQQQAQLIAESYLEEILLKQFYDPDTNTVCPAPEAGRTNYDNVCDYNGLNDNTGALNQFGAVVTGLESYNVTVSVTTVGVTLGSGGSEINNTGAVRVLRVDVVVTHDSVQGLSIPLTGYRTNYNCNAPADAGCKPLT